MFCPIWILCMIVIYHYGSICFRMTYTPEIKIIQWNPGGMCDLTDAKYGKEFLRRFKARGDVFLLQEASVNFTPPRGFRRFSKERVGVLKDKRPRTGGIVILFREKLPYDVVECNLDSEVGIFVRLTQKKRGNARIPSVLVGTGYVPPLFSRGKDESGRIAELQTTLQDYRYLFKFEVYHQQYTCT
jgi:hypothetical protein